MPANKRAVHIERGESTIIVTYQTHRDDRFEPNVFKWRPNNVGHAFAEFTTYIAALRAARAWISRGHLTRGNT